MTARNELIQSLREQVRRVECCHRSAGQSIVSTGCVELDRLFPEQGLRRGTLVEWLDEGNAVGCGAGCGTVSLVAARELCASGRALVVIDRLGTFYPPAAAALGIDLARLLIVRPQNRRDEQWAFDQALRCQAVGAVWGHVEQLASRSLRRMQLAAEIGQSVGLLVRSYHSLQEPAWAEVSLLVRRCAGAAAPRFRVEVARCHGGRAGEAGEFEIDERAAVIRGVPYATHATTANPVHLVSPLARPANSDRKTGT